jgi:cytochrome c biogenesis protein CcdA
LLPLVLATSYLSGTTRALMVSCHNRRKLLLHALCFVTGFSLIVALGAQACWATRLPICR